MLMAPQCFKPVIAQLVEHLTVEFRSDQMVPGSIPGDRISFMGARSASCCVALSLHPRSNFEWPKLGCARVRSQGRALQWMLALVWTFPKAAVKPVIAQLAEHLTVESLQ